MALHRPPIFDPLRFVAAAGRKKTREQSIAEIAYFRAMQRGFTPGHELEDWIAAELEFHRGPGGERPHFERVVHQSSAATRSL
jgi:hypothetical protein